MLCRTRAAGFDRPGNLTLTDMLRVHNMSGFAEAGMPEEEFVDWMLALDSEYLDFHREK